MRITQFMVEIILLDLYWLYAKYESMKQNAAFANALK